MQVGAWELVVGTIAGFVTAFLAEPVKAFFYRRAERRELRAALYRELPHLYAGWKGLVDQVDAQRVPLERFVDNIPSVARGDCYSYAKTRPVVFYSLGESTTIDVIHRNFALVASPHLESPADRLEFARSALEWFAVAVGKNKLDRRRLLRSAPSELRTQLAAVLPAAAAQQREEPG